MSSPGDRLWNSPSYWSVPAEQAFSRARAKARREVILDRIRRRRTTLVPFDEVVEALRCVPGPEVTTQTVPLLAIVGSLGKADLFTRTFLPNHDSLIGRWKKVFALTQGLRGYRPVELYEADGLFYVVDGNFRVSVGRSLGYDSIQATVRRCIIPGS